SAVQLYLGGEFETSAEVLKFGLVLFESGFSLTDDPIVELETANNHGGGEAVTALELLQREKECGSITTFSSQLDRALKGGLPVGKVTEICGAPGVGKTQLCLQLSVDVQVPLSFGGLEGQVIFMDTEGSFVLQRVGDVAAAVVRHFSLVRCHDYVELLAELHLLPDFLRDQPRVRLLVIDSVAFPFRQQLDDLSLRTRLLQGLAQQLVSIATRHNIAVVITNQMTTRLQDSQSHLVPALGEIWGHASTTRILLQWEGSRQVAAIVKSPCCMDTAVQYHITSEGFRDVNQPENSDQPEIPLTERRSL
uniref:DNA repair protein RAD51 homolog 3 n=1 Tax=Oryzias melastigma TaxID=30732 RepID=A0A3B3DEW8_ORYME